MSTPSNGIPYVPENTLDPAAGLNLSLDVIDALLQTFVVDMDRTAPPSSPADGQMHIVATGATGAWAGQANNLARYVAEAAAWQFYSAGLQVRYVLNLKDSGLYVWLSGAWRLLARNPTVEPGYIDGFQMVRVSATQLDVTSGTCYIPSIGANVNSPATISKSGLALTNNTMYHVYFGLLAGVPDIELSTTAPAAPYNGVARNKTGDPARRYIGSFLTNGSGQVRNFLHTPSNGYIGIQEFTNVSPYLVLVGGVATAATTVSCAGFAPPTCRAIVLLASNGSTNSTIALGNPDQTGALTTTNWLQIVPFVSTGNMQLGLTISLSAAQSFSYLFAVAPSPAGADIRATGYYFDR